MPLRYCVELLDLGRISHIPDEEAGANGPFVEPCATLDSNRTSRSNKLKTAEPSAWTSSKVPSITNEQER
jgi:hypothetical protein